MSAGRCSPQPSRECSSMFLTMELARLPCWTTFSRLSFSRPRQFIDFVPDLVGERGGGKQIVQFIRQLRRKRCKVVDEIERVLDLVRDAGGELAEGSQLLGLHQAILGGAQVVEGSGEFPGALLDFVEQADVFDRDHGLVGKRCNQLDLLVGKGPHGFSRSTSAPTGLCLRAEGVLQGTCVVAVALAL